MERRNVIDDNIQLASAAQLKSQSPCTFRSYSLKMAFAFVLCLWIGFAIFSTSLYDETSPQHSMGIYSKQDRTSSLSGKAERRTWNRQTGARRFLSEFVGEADKSSNLETQQEVVMELKESPAAAEASKDYLLSAVSGRGRIRRAGQKDFEPKQTNDGELPRSSEEEGQKEQYSEGIAIQDETRQKRQDWVIEKAIVSGQPQQAEVKNSLNDLEQTDWRFQVAAEKELQRQQILQSLTKERQEYERKAIQAEEALASERLYYEMLVDIKRKIEAEAAEMKSDALDQAEHMFLSERKMEVDQKEPGNPKVIERNTKDTVASEKERDD